MSIDALHSVLAGLARKPGPRTLAVAASVAVLAGGAAGGADANAARWFKDTPTLTVASVMPDGQIEGYYYNQNPDASKNGRYVLFTGTGGHLYRRDMRRAQTLAGGEPPRLMPSDSTLDAGGRFAAFASKLIAGPAAHRRVVSRVFVIDFLRGTTRAASRTFDGRASGGRSWNPSVGGGGRYVAFDSNSGGLVRKHTADGFDVFVRDRRTGSNELVSVAADGGPADGPSFDPELSTDGRTVVFTSGATDLVPGDTNGRRDVFMRNLEAGVTTLVSVASDGAQSTGPAIYPTVSGDGTTVAWSAPQNAFDPNDVGREWEVFVHDSATGATSRVAPGTSGGYSFSATVSEHGRFVAYSSSRDVPSVPAGCGRYGYDVFLLDRLSDSTTCVSPAPVDSEGDSLFPVVASHGGRVVFRSQAQVMPGVDEWTQGLVYRWQR